MKSTKKLLVMLLATTLSMAGTMTAFAEQWHQNNTGWWYEYDDKSYSRNGWYWIHDRCYYFNANGYMLANTTTPDGYTVDASGAWTVDGVPQTMVSTIPTVIGASK